MSIRRRALLGELDLFNHLPEPERDALAARMRPAPFAAGETVHRQGADAHWLYVLASGEVEERVGGAGFEETVCQVKAPGIFGEMSLMTGSPRLATIVAITDVECFRLDKHDFEKIMRLPAVAEHMAAVIARRRMDIDRARGQLDQETARRKLSDTELDVLGRIRRFFGIDQGAG